MSFLEESYRIGQTIARPFRLSQNDSPIDMTGWTLRLTLKASPYQSDDEAACIVEATEYGNGWALGECQFVIHPSITSTLDPINYYFDVEAELTGGGEPAVIPLVQGRVRILAV